MVNEIRVPGDKSISHRSLIFASLAKGESRVRSILQSEDVRSTAGVLRTLGAAIPELSNDFLVPGGGVRGLRAPVAPLDCGNSGTTARLMCGVAAALPFETRFVGDASLSKRPMRRLTRVLAEMGAGFEFENGSDGLPMRVRGARLREISFVNESGSAQIKSALLLAGLVSGVRVTVSEPRRSRDHTEIMLRAAGADVTVVGDVATIDYRGELRALDFEVPADPSSAAFFAARAAMLPGSSVVLKDVCLNPTRIGFFRALEKAGAAVRFTDVRHSALGELVGNIEVDNEAEGGALRGISIERTDVPALVDELPLIACIGARADGATRVTGAEELRLKESDRINAIVSNLRAIGVQAEELADGFVVQGSGRALSGRVTTHGDHRIAMAFGILGSLPGNNLEIDDRGCVAISYPGFWSDLGAFR